MICFGDGCHLQSRNALSQALYLPAHTSPLSTQQQHMQPHSIPWSGAVVVGALGCTYNYSTACITVAVASASRYAGSVGRTCGGGAAVSTGTQSALDTAPSCEGHFFRSSTRERGGAANLVIRL